jgi:hypothetical protein
MLASTECDAKDFKWHHGQSYVWGSQLDLHEPKGQIDIVDWLFVAFAVMCAVAVAPAVWRNWAAIRLALGRIYSDFRDYPEW